MSLILTSLISALVPAGVDILKDAAGGLGRKIGGLSVDDEIKIKNADVERLKAIAAMDAPFGTPSQWVVDLRLSFRYIAAGLFLIGGLGVVLTSAYTPALAPIAPAALEMAASSSSFIFGERMLIGLKSKATV